MGEEVKISIPADMYKRLSEKIKDSGFASVEDYLIFVINELLAEEEEVMSEEDEKKVKDRLRALGYLE
ncbi:MAG: CopG family transcriptional regulator [Thermoplasmata archaeon]|nr:MAG: CopG family transcriptional regulator [Thermoplasmata archaeon]